MHFRGYFKRCKGNTHNNNPCDKWAEPRSRFCCDHVCLIRNCVKLRVEGIRTCAFRRSLALPLKLHHLTCTYSDTCRTRLCSNIVTPTKSTPAKYCSVHACSQQHCLRDTVADVSFCKAHACIRDDCTLVEMSGVVELNLILCRHLSLISTINTLFCKYIHIYSQTKTCRKEKL